ncbi:hypothetical protein PROFUN_15994 [Planoprotostelium fungivorum]|uniref:Uncharacterized protein n=1 Tax=Planoprotostelium fungivorum TaxID=1890364 RepID=A0A2P6MTC3_9EUKA|nr:hypothetical protein PROFUN_15994 [Planoprotostelium fungivorum]
MKDLNWSDAAIGTSWLRVGGMVGCSDLQVQVFFAQTETLKERINIHRPYRYWPRQLTIRETAGLAAMLGDSPMKKPTADIS